MSKLKPSFLGFWSAANVDRLVFIVGQWPGKQRRDVVEKRVFFGNRTGDFLQSALKDYNMAVYATNAHNWQRPVTDVSKQKYLDKGLIDLKADIEHFKPVGILCLGTVAKEQVQRTGFSGKTSCIEHPSYVLRFNRNIKAYRENMVKELRTLCTK